MNASALCDIHWVDPPRINEPTPDDGKPAVGWAICHDSAYGPLAFLICEDHARRFPMDGWQYLPGVGETARDERLAELRVVTAAIKKWAKGRSDRDAEEIIRKMRRWDRYYGFEWAGMFVGVEFDGYIHT